MTSPSLQRGGTFFGFLLGLIVGLVVATAVVYRMNRDSIPILDGKYMSRPGDSGQDNQNWNPNQKIDQAYVASAPAPSSSSAADSEPASAASAVMSKPQEVIANNRSANPSQAPTVATATNSSTDSSGYFLQIGAFKSQNDAKEQSAKLQLMGFNAKVTQAESGSGVVYRVRLGPYAQLNEVKAAKNRLTAEGISSFEVAPNH